MNLIKPTSNADAAKLATNDNIIEAVDFVPASATNKLVTKKQYKPIVYLAALVFVIVSVVLLFLFSAKSVVVSTAPSSANISITGGFHFKLGDHWLMRSGDYQVQATLAGYYPIKQSFTVTGQQNQQQSFSFNALPGELLILSNAGVDVLVSIDGKAAVLSQGVIKDIAAGEHQLSVTADSYFEHQSSIDIIGKQQRQTLSVELTPAWAAVTINSKPLGAQVFHQQVLLGITPLTTNLLEGEQLIQIEKSGYQSMQHEISVVAGQRQDINAVKLFKHKGRLSLTSKPSGLSVTLGDQYLGTTPLSVEVMPDQQQTLLLFKDGYQSQQSTLLVPSGESITKHFQLHQIVAQMNFKVIPQDALLYVDDRLMGRANQKITLPSKQQSIRIEKTGYVSYQASLLPKPDVNQVLDVRLKTIEQAKWENMKPLITTASGSQLKLFKTNDVFEMGASRREQGRRANEVKRRVQLTKPFYLGLMEISNKEFRQFEREHSSGHVKGNSLNSTDQPVVEVTWLQAAQFCNWLSLKEKLTPVYQIEAERLLSFELNNNGYRLPTEAEWAWASRYVEGKMIKFSWGSSLPPGNGAGNFADISGAPILGTILPSYNDKFITTAPIGAFAKNEKGIYDLSGNVAEWLHDYYQISTGTSLKTKKDPVGPKSGDYHLIRGSSWAHGSQTTLRLSFRDYGKTKRNDVGFRIAKYAH
jgi:formylglycine-generating enzyme required for sulfatase activity